LTRRTLLGNFKNKNTGVAESVWLHSVASIQELDPYIPSLVECYKQVFAGPPYFENYDGKEETYIIPSFKKFAADGILVMLVNGSQHGAVLGFGAGIAADQSEVSDFILANVEKFEVLLAKYLYMAELGVLPNFQGQGLGLQLIKARMEAGVFDGEDSMFSFCFFDRILLLIFSDFLF